MKAPPRVLIGSSPGRAEKLPPPPFSRLLKGKGGSRSRGRSTHRSSPMFAIRRRQPVEEKEPGSPKVTCIGQVRIGKKHRGDHEDGNNTQKTKKKHKKKNIKKTKKKLLGWDDCHIHKSRLCNPFSRGESTFEWQKWRKWLTCYPNRDRRQLLEKEDVVDPTKPQALEVHLSEEDEVELEKEEEFEPVAPPKNALLLMRCRSAPQRGSPLTSRFWVPEEEPEEGDTHGEGAKGGQVEAAAEEEKSSREEGEVTGGSRSPSCSLPSRPLILTRCKSEPARRWAGSKQNGCGRYYSPSKSRTLLALADEAFPRPLPLR